MEAVLPGRLDASEVFGVVRRVASDREVVVVVVTEDSTEGSDARVQFDGELGDVAEFAVATNTQTAGVWEDRAEALGVGEDPVVAIHGHTTHADWHELFVGFVLILFVQLGFGVERDIHVPRLARVERTVGVVAVVVGCF